MAKRREFNVFSLSFLDIMSCGFGAVILIFVIINHGSETTEQVRNADLVTQVRKLESQIEQGSDEMGRLQQEIQSSDDVIFNTADAIEEIQNEIQLLTTQITDIKDSGASNKNDVESLKSELKTLSEEAASLQASVDEQEKQGGSARSFLGDGDRQYLTGLNLGGERILILMDASASMLDQTIVNIIRRRNMSDELKRQAPKWQRAIKTVEWISANLPPESEVQIVTFNDQVNVLTGKPSEPWIKANDNLALDKAIATLKQSSPENGTSLHRAFTHARQLDREPDSIFLLIDSLPTIGLEPPKNTLINGRNRVRLFSSSLDELPTGIPVNVILFPMEGDPIAAASYWRLAQFTGGSFLSPSKDWP